MAIALDASLGTLNQDSAATSIVLTTSSAVASGAFIVVGVTYSNNTAAITTVTGGGLTWNVDKDGAPGSNPGAFLATGIVSAQAPSGLASSTAITVNFSGSFGARIIGGTSFTGVATSSPVDGTATGPTVAADSTAWATASYAITAGSMLYTVCFTTQDGTGSTITSPALEAWEQLRPADAYGAVAGYRVEGSASSYTIAGVWQGGGVPDSSNVAVAYLAAAGGGGAEKQSFYAFRRRSVTR